MALNQVFVVFGPSIWLGVLSQACVDGSETPFPGEADGLNARFLGKV